MLVIFWGQKVKGRPNDQENRVNTISS